MRDRLSQRPSTNIEERLLDRLDPANQLERLSRFLWHREQLAAMRGNWMYFYTDLGEGAGRGLLGINIHGEHSGAWARGVRVGDPDERFFTDEINELLYTASGNKLSAYSLVEFRRIFRS